MPHGVAGALSFAELLDLVAFLSSGEEQAKLRGGGAAKGSG